MRNIGHTPEAPISILRIWIPNKRVIKYSLSPPVIVKSDTILILNLVTLQSTMNNSFLRKRHLRGFVEWNSGRLTVKFGENFRRDKEVLCN